MSPALHLNFLKGYLSTSYCFCLPKNVFNFHISKRQYIKCFFNILYISFVSMYVRQYMHAMVHVSRAEGRLWELALFLHHVNSKDGTQVINLGGKWAIFTSWAIFLESDTESWLTVFVFQYFKNVICWLLAFIVLKRTQLLSLLDSEYQMNQIFPFVFKVFFLPLFDVHSLSMTCSDMGLWTCAIYIYWLRGCVKYFQQIFFL